jgi:DnaJ-domain-containing protein 1
MLRAVASLSSSAVGRPVVPPCARRAPCRGPSARAPAARLRARARGEHASWDSSSGTHPPPSHSVATAFFDAYAALEIPDDASSTQIRASYVALQKKFHPDVYSGDDASERSSDVNRAYEILVDDVKRADLDAAIRRLGKSRRREDSATLIPATGIVGPLRAALLHKMDVCGAEVHGLEECEADVVWRMTESIREWGKMLAFTSELPLPLPLQCDDVENGVRLAMVAFENGVVREVGALVITVEVVGLEDDLYGTSQLAGFEDSSPSSEHKVEVRVSRRWQEVANPMAYQSNPLPGEGRILANFAEEFAFLKEAELAGSSAVSSAAFGVAEKKTSSLNEMLSNAVSAISSFALPILPMLGSSNPKGGAYEGYKINRAPRSEREEEKEEVKEVVEEESECLQEEECELAPW